jgi:uncharacterized membrane protein YozB (DUF420 family)
VTLSQIPFPFINATLNATSAVFLLIAYVMIKARRIRSHTILMIAALFTSTAFLACYITYHIDRAMHHAVITRFPAGTVWRPIYLTILTTHTLLAVIILPLVIMTFWRAIHRRWDAHRRIAVWTFPLWLYVSVTGVVIYWMLYRFAPTLR